MTLQERLREQGQITKTVVLGAPADSRVLSERFIPDPLCHEAADALDAKDARIKELEGALRECADDLEAELTHRYDGMLNYPVMKRRYDSDMSTVTRAREALK